MLEGLVSEKVQVPGEGVELFEGAQIEAVRPTPSCGDVDAMMLAAKPLLARLTALAHRLSPGMRKKLNALNDNGNVAVLNEDLEAVWGEKISSLADFFDLFSFEELRLAGEWRGEPFERPKGVDPFLFELAADVVNEILRQKLFIEEAKVEMEYLRLRIEIGRTLKTDGLDELIRRLGNESIELNGSLDFPVSTSPINTRLDRALRALRNDFEREKIGENVEELRQHTRKFVLGVLNPQLEAKFWNITDVYGVETKNPDDGENDVTRLRVQAHREEIEARHGVKLEVFDQGTSIECPEQCGFDVLVALNQARRADLNKKIESRFVVLNNAARLTEADGIEGGAQAAASSSLVYFSFDLGDSVLHHGVAYGKHTLTFLKPYITELYELDGTDKGSQFRSLEYQQHIATLSAMADGALPACYKAKMLQVGEMIPDLKLKPNQAMLIGRDKFGNGLLAIEASKWIDTVLDPEQSFRAVQVRFFSRSGEPYCEEPEVEDDELVCDDALEHLYQKYFLARNLGSLRGGEPALWESSTPTTQDPRRGYLSIGVFKANRGDVNEEVINLSIGDIVEIVIGDENAN